MIKLIICIIVISCNVPKEYTLLIDASKGLMFRVINYHLFWKKKIFVGNILGFSKSCLRYETFGKGCTVWLFHHQWFKIQNVKHYQEKQIKCFVEGVWEWYYSIYLKSKKEWDMRQEYDVYYANPL